MTLKENELHLSLLQLKELAALYGKDSAVVRAAQKFNFKRRAFKKSSKLFMRRLFKKPAPKPQDRLKMLVHVRGGIGDVSMTRVFVKRLREKFPSALIYFCYDSEAVVRAIFPDSSLIDGFASRKYDPKEYDLVIAGCHAFNFDHFDAARLQHFAPEWMADFEKARALQQKLEVVINNTPHLDGLWAKISVAYGSSRIQNMGLTTGIDVAQNDRALINFDQGTLTEILNRRGLAGVRYVTLHDGTNTNTDLHGRQATRCWPRTRWEEFGRLFKSRFPHIKLVQLGGANSVPFDFADICLVGKTPVEELPYIVQGALLHIDGESGMVHLSNLTDTRAVVLFGPSPLEYLAYARNANLRADNCRNCMCIYPDWMSRCPLFERNECLWAITPERVLQEAAGMLEQNADK